MTLVSNDKTAVLYSSLCAVVRKPRKKKAFKINRQVIRPKKNVGGRNGRENVSRCRQLIDGGAVEMDSLELYGNKEFQAIKPNTRERGALR